MAGRNLWPLNNVNAVGVVGERMLVLLSFYSSEHSKQRHVLLGVPQQSVLRPSV
jgi:hypothetical protein